MGEVFSAVHERLGQTVALKLLTRSDPASRARFVREARALSVLEHPGVVRVLYLGEHADGVPYLVMEQVTGRTLRETLRDHPAGMPVREALAIIAQVATALAAVHQRHIVHRDLKPENLMLVPHASGPDAIKVIDFGIARVPSQDWSGPDTLVETAEDGPRWLGSVAYMAPEQCRQRTEIGPSADVYALGIILYELLCGVPPFRESDPVALAAMHIRDEPDLSVVPDARLRPLLAAMLHKAPLLRPAMAAVAVALTHRDLVDEGRRWLSQALPLAAGLLAVGAGGWLLETRRRQVSAPFSGSDGIKDLWASAIDRSKNGVLSPQMRPSGLILVDHVEQGTISLGEMRAALPAEYESLPVERVTVPASGIATFDDFPAAEQMVTAWYRQVLEPLLNRHPDYRIVYFGVAPIAVIVCLGWLIQSLHPVEVRLRHHQAKRFLPWRSATRPVLVLPPRWRCPVDASSEQAGDVVVRIATSHPLNEDSLRQRVPAPVCEVEIALSHLGEDAFESDVEVAAVADAWKQVLDQITVRYPRVKKVHLFASVQAGLALLLGTRVSATMHPMIQTYQYRAGEHRPALLLNQLPRSDRRTKMPFQSEFERFHRNILLEDNEHYAKVRSARDQVLRVLQNAKSVGSPWTTFEPFNSGSYAMGTGIRPISGEYDIDIGLVFNTRPTPEAWYLKRTAYLALQQAGYKPNWQRPCISVSFSHFHIDMSICCRESESRLFLAEGKQHDAEARWRPDGMESFVQMIKTHPNSSDCHQFRRIVRYLKRWKDIHFSENGMQGPVGLALTVMGYRWFAPQPGDDFKALRIVVQQAVNFFQQGNTELLFPYEPKDNLLRKLKGNQVRQLQSRFEQLHAWLKDASDYQRLDGLRLAFGEDFR